MPLKAGKSQKTIHENIHEMVKAGHPLKSAIAASIANSRKYAMGGMVDEDDDLDADHERNIVELNEEGSEQGAVANPHTLKLESMLADKLHEQAEDEEVMHMSEGGMVEEASEMPKDNEIIEAMRKHMSDKKKKMMLRGGM